MDKRPNTAATSSILVLAGGWVLDPGRWNGEAGVWIRNGVIDAVVSPDVCPLDEAVCIDVSGLLVLPGFVDLHVHLRERGDVIRRLVGGGCVVG